MVVLVTGASGQLGQAIQSISRNYSLIEFVFCSSSELDITNKENCEIVFKKHQPQFCINAAAYTAWLIRPNQKPEKAFAINVTGAQHIAEVCKSYNTVLLHISTDFVFDTKFEDGIAYYDSQLRLPLKSNKGLVGNGCAFSSRNLRINQITRRASHSSYLGKAFYYQNFLGVFTIWT